MVTGLAREIEMTMNLSIIAVSLLSKQAALRGKNKDWLARNKDNLSQLRNMSTQELLHQRAST
jgi:hypothetical protein